jgi:hypothetical protein
MTLAFAIDTNHVLFCEVATATAQFLRVFVDNHLAIDLVFVFDAEKTLVVWYATSKMKVTIATLTSSNAFSLGKPTATSATFDLSFIDTHDQI